MQSDTYHKTTTTLDLDLACKPWVACCDASIVPGPYISLPFTLSRKGEVPVVAFLVSAILDTSPRGSSSHSFQSSHSRRSSTFVGGRRLRP